MEIVTNVTIAVGLNRFTKLRRGELIHRDFFIRFPIGLALS